MCSYKNLAILALAAPFVSPALSAPDSTNQPPESLTAGLLAGVGDAAIAVPALALGTFYIIDKAGAKPKVRPISVSMGTMTGRTLGDYDHTE